MSTLRKPWFITFCLLWCGVFLCRKMHFVLPAPVTAYLADLLAVPVIAQLGLWFMRFPHGCSERRLGKRHIIFIVLYVSLIFELILPYYFPQRYVADVLDLACYAAGGLFYAYRMNR